MPKTKKIAVKEMKKKLSPEELSQIAKDRWAKRRGEEDSKNVVMGGDVSTSSTEPTSVIIPIPPPEQPPVDPESIAPGMSGEPINIAPFRPAQSMMSVRYEPTLAPQLAPVAPKKQNRYTGPKEFSVALKAAEGRLAKAIVERAEAAGKMAMLQAEIPSLVQIINALKGQQNIPAVPYDPYATNAQFQAPVPQQYAAPTDPLAAIQAAMAAPPVSRASGGAVQFAPEMVGTLDGPDDDDPDRFISGPNAGGGWIGG